MRTMVEERLHAELDGWHISGAIDLQILHPEGISIRDYKTTSVWAVMKEKYEWELQLNIYAWLVEKVKQAPIVDLGIVAIIRDWSRRDAGNKEGYPESPIKELPIKLWPMAEREAYISKRIAMHSACDFAMETSGDLPECTPEDMWEKPAVWAIKKKGNIRAKALYDAQDKAEEAIKDLGKEFEIEYRPGERTRCMSYCPVSSWCEQWRKYNEAV
jgi:PD-(D/E)XK nuclease superfamily